MRFPSEASSAEIVPTSISWPPPMRMYTGTVLIPVSTSRRSQGSGEFPHAHTEDRMYARWSSRCARLASPDIPPRGCPSDPAQVGHRDERGMAAFTRGDDEVDLFSVLEAVGEMAEQAGDSTSYRRVPGRDVLGVR